MIMKSDDENAPTPASIFGSHDYSDVIPDECLAVIFQFLISKDRKNCSLVCRRWSVVEGQSRRRLTLNAKADLIPHVPAIFSRFDSVTELSLRCHRESPSISGEALVLISLRCRNLTRLKLRCCRDTRGIAMAAFARNCKRLRMFSCERCAFGSRGMNALLDNCSSLEKLSVKHLCGVVAEPIGPGAAASSLKSIRLKYVYNGECFGPLITGSRNLKTLKLLRSGDWDRVLETLARGKNNLVQIHLDTFRVSDVGLTAVSNCLDLKILRLAIIPDCTDAGVAAVAKNCKLLRKLHINVWRTNRIGDEGLIAIAENSENLKELVLNGLKPSITSLSAIASNCVKLERLVLCGSETIGDPEVSCIARTCVALKKLYIRGCKVSDEGIQAFASGCPNLVELRVMKCKHVTGEVADWLRVKRHSLAVHLDIEQVKIQTASE